jgi:hypothetical protein
MKKEIFNLNPQDTAKLVESCKETSVLVRLPSAVNKEIDFMLLNRNFEKSKVEKITKHDLVLKLIWAGIVSLNS